MISAAVFIAMLHIGHAACVAGKRWKAIAPRTAGTTKRKAIAAIAASAACLS